MRIGWWLVGILAPAVAAAGPLGAYKRTDIGKWWDVQVAPDGASLALVGNDRSVRVRDLATGKDRFTAPISSTGAYGFGRSYNGTQVTFTGTDRAHIIDANTATLIDAPCPGGLALGAATTDTQLALLCKGGVAVWSLGATPRSLGTGKFGVDSHVIEGTRTVRVTADGSLLDAERHGTIVISKTGLQRWLRSSDGWYCDRKTCIDRFTHVLSDARTYVTVRGTDAGEPERTGDVVDLGPPRKLQLELREVVSGKVLQKLSLPANTTGLDVAGTTAVVTFDWTVRSIELPSLRRRADATGLGSDASGENRISPDGTRFAVGSMDGIDVIDTANGGRQHIACAMGYGVEFKFLGGSKLLIASGRGGASECIGTYDLTGPSPAKLAGAELTFAAASPDLKTLVASDGKTFFVFTK